MLAKLKIETAFEIYHLHGPDAIVHLSKGFNVPLEQLAEDIKTFENNLTEPYEIKGLMNDKEVVIMTIGGKK
jgi:hypothetical protein